MMSTPPVHVQRRDDGFTSSQPTRNVHGTAPSTTVQTGRWPGAIVPPSVSDSSVTEHVNAVRVSTLPVAQSKRARSNGYGPPSENGTPATLVLSAVSVSKKRT